MMLRKLLVVLPSRIEAPSSCLISRYLSSKQHAKSKEPAPSATKTQAKAAAPKEEKVKPDQLERKPQSVAGKTFQELLHRGRGGNALALGDLRKLLEMCQSPEEVKYATQAVALYQRKGQDFSEEVNSHFVKACIRGGQPTAAATEFAKYGSRIGAWTTPASFDRLATSLEASGAANECISMVHTLSLKGVKLKTDSVAIALKAAAATGDNDVYSKTVESAVKLLGAEEAKSVATQYPLIVDKVEATPPADDAGEAAPAPATATETTQTEEPSAAAAQPETKSGGAEIAAADGSAKEEVVTGKIE